MIGQFFILSPRGDCIINKDYRGDAHPTMHDTFFRKVKFWEKGEAPPVFKYDGVTYIYIRKTSLLIVCTTRFNVSPSNIIELLNRIAKVFKDYCGVLNEDSIRKNFILLYELLDEMLDFGYPQTTSTEVLRECVHNEAQSVAPLPKIGSMRMTGLTPKTMPSNASNKPVSVISIKNPRQKNEIFVDIIERITVLFNTDGIMVNAAIDGSIQMKSYLAGNPELRLALNEDLVIGKGGGVRGSVVLDDCNFHECVRLDEFETSRTLVFLPPDGEFSVLNYRVTGDFQPPFRIGNNVEEVGPYKLDIFTSIRADIPESNHGNNVIIVIPVPRATVACAFELPQSGSSVDYNANERQIVWTVRKFTGLTELNLRAKLTLDSPVTVLLKKEIGPVAMTFEIPMYNVSNLQVRYLRISETGKSYNPFRWVRYVTQSSSYVSRVKAT